MSGVGRNGPSVTCGGDGGRLGWGLEFQLDSGSSIKPKDF